MRNYTSQDDDYQPDNGNYSQAWWDEYDKRLEERENRLNRNWAIAISIAAALVLLFVILNYSVA